MKDSNKYLIIGGSTKCGTTSVYNYFEFHPSICPCRMKESRYFLEKDYLLNAAQRSENLTEKFSGLFEICQPTSIRLEATPDYLYSQLAAHKIYDELSSCKIIFILRNPINRLWSWYRFASLNGLIEKDITFEKYIKLQQSNNDNAPQHMKSLVHGRYAEFIESYFKIFGKQSVHVCFYENLELNAQQFCKEICEFAGLDEKYFDNYDFKIYNKTIHVKSVTAHRLFRKLKRTIRPFTKLFPPAIRKRLKLAGHNVEKAYSSANAEEKNPAFEISNEMKKFLNDYYAASNKKLTEITGLEIPW